MTSQLSQGNDHNRFASLIQPIKDLAANWDIDIAESLGDYLDELDNLRITMNGGQTQLNFAEAALLIQGSTAVYSKKVEYLHQLMLKSLEFITQRKASRNSTNSANNTNGDQGDANDKSYDEDFLMNFGNLDEGNHDLLLDHLIEEGDNIDLPNQPRQPHAVSPQHDLRMNLDSSVNKSQSDTSRVSISLLHSLLQDAGGNGTSLKLLSSAYLDQSGALLLGAFRPSYFKPLSSANNDVSVLSTAGNNAEPMSSVHSHEAPENHYYDDDAGHYDHYDADMGGEDQHYTQPDFDSAFSTNTNTEPIPSATTASTATENAIRTVNTNRANGAPLTQLPVVAQRELFALLDPHSVLPGSRPVCRGRPFRQPSKTQWQREAEEDVRQQSRRLFVLPSQQPDPLLALLFSTTFESNSMARNSKINKKKVLPVKGLLQPCYLPLLQLKRKLQRAQRLRDLRQRLSNNQQNIPQQLMAAQHMSLLDDCIWENVHTVATQPDVMDPHNTANSNSHNDYPKDQYDRYDDYVDDDHYYEGGAELAVELSEEDELKERSRRIEQALQQEQLGLNLLSEGRDGHNSGSQSYEMLCRQYLDGFQRGADAFARETQLSMRVASWTSKLEPLLQRQEEEKVFDIHAYSDEVLIDLTLLDQQHHNKNDDMKDSDVPSGEMVSFTEVVAGRSSAEVCRVFLACLQLANLGNVDVIRPIDGNIQPTSSNNSNSNYKNNKYSTNTASVTDIDYFAPFQLRLLRAERITNDLVCLSATKETYNVDDEETIRQSLKQSNAAYKSTKATKGNKKFASAVGKKALTKKRKPAISESEDEEESDDDSDEENEKEKTEIDNQDMKEERENVTAQSRLSKKKTAKNQPSKSKQGLAARDINRMENLSAMRTSTGNQVV